MKMHNDPHSWQGWLELFQSWWRGDTPLGAVLMSLFMAGLRIAYFGGSGGWKKKTLEILLCGALTLTFSSALEYFGWPKSLSVAIGGGVGLIGVDAIRGFAMKFIGGVSVGTITGINYESVTISAGGLYQRRTGRTLVSTYYCGNERIRYYCSAGSGNVYCTNGT
ncbi:phage holin, lambda family [Salmonella enterica subsp. arizonae]|nr:phage holin, lambda family [Salmonella enterica subsp. arizonae]